MFKMTIDVVISLKKTSNCVKERGISEIQVEKVGITIKNIEAVSFSLNKFDSLTEEYPLDILNGLYI